MSGLVWLHLSDWHQRVDEYDRGAVRDELIQDLQRRAEIDPRLAQVDFIVFSGDLAFSGDRAEYVAAGKELLDPVLEATGVPKNRLFLIPGNHDLSRPTLKLLAPLRSLFATEQDVNKLLLDEAKSEVVSMPMREYSRFVQGYLGEISADRGFSYLRAFSVRDIPLALVGMNSAWMCGQHEEVDPATGRREVRDQGYLLLGEPQFTRPAGKAEFKSAALRIGVLHHPTDWFDKNLLRWQVDAALERTFHFLLRGHEHVSLAARKSGPDGTCMVISAGAAYDRREYFNGYNFAFLDFDGGEGTLFFRRYDEGRGFHKDTVTTGDASPGIYRFELPGRSHAAPQVAVTGRQNADIPPLAIRQIRDARSPQVLAALELYDERIPEDERLQTPDIMRFLREDQARMAAGKPPYDFFFVAERGNQVCGFSLLHSDDRRELAFIAYLVAAKAITVDHGTISSCLLTEVARLFEAGGALARCTGILLEVDDPRLARDDDARRERIARIRLFCTLAEREGFSLRALDFDYRQPLLEVPALTDRGKELGMLLMYARRQQAGLEGALPRERVAALLGFIYKWLYPEGFSVIAAENDAYRQYLDGFYATQIDRLPESVPLLGLSKIRVRCTGLEEAAAQT